MCYNTIYLIIFYLICNTIYTIQFIQYILTNSKDALMDRIDTLSPSPGGTQLTNNIDVHHFIINLTNLMCTKQFI